MVVTDFCALYKSYLQFFNTVTLTMKRKCNGRSKRTAKQATKSFISRRWVTARNCEHFPLRGTTP